MVRLEARAQSSNQFGWRTGKCAVGVTVLIDKKFDDPLEHLEGVRQPCGSFFCGWVLRRQWLIVEWKRAEMLGIFWGYGWDLLGSYRFLVLYITIAAKTMFSVTKCGILPVIRWFRWMDDERRSGLSLDLKIWLMSPQFAFLTDGGVVRIILSGSLMLKITPS